MNIIVNTKTHTIEFNKNITQSQLVLVMLHINGSATKDQLREMGIKSPSAVICKLRNRGHVIVSKSMALSSSVNPYQVIQQGYMLISNIREIISNFNMEDFE